MRWYGKKVFNNNKGGAFIEVAIMMPVILILLFGYLSVVNVVRHQMILQTAVREGARHFANPQTGESITQAASRAEDIVMQEISRNAINANGIQVNAFADGYKRYVVVTKPFAFSGIAMWLLGDAFIGDLQASSVFYVEPYDEP